MEKKRYSQIKEVKQDFTENIICLLTLITISNFGFVKAVSLFSHLIL